MNIIKAMLIAIAMYIFVFGGAAAFVYLILISNAHPLFVMTILSVFFIACIAYQIYGTLE